VNIYPAATITKGAARGLPVESNVVFNICGDRTGKTPIALTYVTGTDPVCFAQGYGITLTHESKAWFETTDGRDIGLFEDDKLYLVPDGAHMHCVCGGNETGDPNHKCSDVYYVKAPATANGTINTDTNWYLDGDLTLIQYAMNIYNAEVNICTNGHNIVTGENHGGRMIALFDNATKNPELTLTTCTKYGDPTANRLSFGKDREAADMGMIVWVRYGTAHIYGVTLDGRNITTKNAISNTEGVSEKNGAVISNSGKLYIYKGANIFGAKTMSYTYTKKDGTKSSYPNLVIFNMEDIELSDSSAAPQAKPASQPKPAAAKPKPAPVDDPDDELPFN
jgi:hypothetical protein